MTVANSISPRARGLARYRDEFPIFRDRIYLNTCSLGALGERTRRKVAEFLDLWQSRGASAWYDVWSAALSDLRARYGRIVNAAPAEIALAPSISVAISAFAESLDYRNRPRVVTTSLDFPTVAYQWLAKAPRGVEVVVVESPDRISVPVEAIARAIDQRTALVATSHVYFTSGAIQDIKSIAAVSIRRPGAGGCKSGGRGRTGGGWAQVAARRAGHRVSLRPRATRAPPRADDRRMVRAP
jgi:selenocysteine lyase/cysteine desulfurase